MPTTSVGPAQPCAGFLCGHTAAFTIGAVRAGTRRIVTRLAGVACPPGGLDAVRGAVVDDVVSHLSLLPPLGRRGIGPALHLFDQLARVRARGRRFVRLDDAAAAAYLGHVLAGRSGPVAVVVRLVKGLLALAYYEQPTIAAGMGYDPAGYIAEVSARRLARYGPEVEGARSGTDIEGVP